MVVTGTSSAPASGAIFAGYGTGGYVPEQLENVTGDKIATYLNALSIARNINSGDSISGSATLSGTFATRGITAGTSWTTFTLDGEENTLNYVATSAGASSVPEPSTAIAMGLLGILGFAGNRRRRRQESVA